MPRSFGSLVGFVVMAVVTVAVGLAIVTRIPGAMQFIQPRQ